MNNDNSPLRKNTIELKHLRYAIAIEKHGSLRKAAFALGIKQSTLSRSLAQLEARLGLELYERSSSGVRLTKAGVDVIRTSRHIVDVLDLMTANARSINHGYTGSLSVGFYTSLSAGNLRTRLVEFATRYPNLELCPIEASRSRLLSSLSSGLLDIAILTGEPAHGEPNTMSLWTERIMTVLPEAHPLTEKNVIYWADLRDETFLLPQGDPGPTLRKTLAHKIALIGVEPKFVNQDVSAENITSLVAAGFGVSLVIESAIGAAFPGVTFREVRDGNGPSWIRYTAQWRSDNHNPALANFIALLEERYPSTRVFD